jgi:hypothetical protein
MGALWELPGSSLGALWELVAVAGIVEMKIDDLPSEFILTESQIECLIASPQYIVQNHIQVVNHNGTFYHLNPDLVFDVNQIVLCLLYRKSNDQRSREYCSRQ